MVNAPKKNFSLLLAGKYGKWTKQSTQRRYQVNEGNSSLEAERVLALGVLRSLWSKMKLAAETWRVTHFLSNEEKETWIEDDVERETAGARMRGEDTEAAVQQEQEDRKTAGNARLTNRQPKKTFREMMVVIGHSLSDLASSVDGEDGQDEDENETEQGQLSEDDNPGWLMGTITNKAK